MCARVQCDQELQEGACRLRLSKFLNAGRHIAQVKMDFVIPMETKRLGSLGCAISVGIVKDNVTSLPVSTLLTANGYVVGWEPHFIVGVCAIRRVDKGPTTTGCCSSLTKTTLTRPRCPRYALLLHPPCLPKLASTAVTYSLRMCMLCV